ncbi:MAG: SDR family oxidoreductase [Flavobacteriales bacterium]|nr:SDR family oxidoreductase [Flavobacteriales bacterium]
MSQHNTKTIIVTGAGSGMGRATACLLSANKDHRIILVGRRKELLDETLQLMERPSDHFTLNLDVRESAAWVAGLKKIGAEMLNISAVFANAGIGGENHYGEKDSWHEIISTNLDGTYVTIMETLPFLKKSTGVFKHVVITSSCLGRFGVPNYTAYCTAKTGLLGLTRSLAVQLAQENILVNAICPGWVETDMAKASIQRLADRNGQSYETAFAEQMSFVPLNRISQPSEIAELVAFLMSDKQTSITGQSIDINNGSFMI